MLCIYYNCWLHRRPPEASAAARSVWGPRPGTVLGPGKGLDVATERVPVLEEGVSCHCTQDGLGKGTGDC